MTALLTGAMRSQGDRVWDAFWSGGVSNPLSVIEQFTYLLFARRVESEQAPACYRRRRIRLCR